MCGLPQRNASGGNCIQAGNHLGRTEYYYDQFDRLTKATFDYPQLRKTVGYEYDPQGRVVRTLARQPCQFRRRFEHNTLPRPGPAAAGIQGTPGNRAAEITSSPLSTTISRSPFMVITKGFHWRPVSSNARMRNHGNEEGRKVETGL